MRERLPFLVGYVGSAAVVAFLAACIDAPRVATFTCETPPGASEERCSLAETLADPRGREREAAAARERDLTAIALNTLD